MPAAPSPSEALVPGSARSVAMMSATEARAAPAETPARMGIHVPRMQILDTRSPTNESVGTARGQSRRRRSLTADALRPKVESGPHAGSTTSGYSESSLDVPRFCLRSALGLIGPDVGAARAAYRFGRLGRRLPLAIASGQIPDRCLIEAQFLRSFFHLHS